MGVVVNAPGAGAGTRVQDAGRKVYIDYLRVIATIFVIAVHTVSLASSRICPGENSFFVLEVFDFTFLSSNLLFIMISGALLLPVRGEKTGSFFARRFGRVAVPMVIYYILYVCAKEGLGCLKPARWPWMLQRILIGPPVEAPHFWLVYVILWLYVMTPFFRWILQHIPDTVLAGVIAVIFLVNALETYLPVFGLNAHLAPVVDSYAGVFLLGYFLAEKCSKRAENLFIAGGIISYVLSCFLIFNSRGAYVDYIYENAPTMMLFTAAIFLVVKRAASNKKNAGVFTRLVGKYSFSILLIHWGVLHFAVKQVLRVDVLSGGIVGGCVLMIVLTFLLSLIGAWVIDNTLVRLVLLIFHGIGFGVRKLCQRLRAA